MKIREEFPITMPVVLAHYSWFPMWLLRKLMPAADHWSGTTPRWRAMPEIQSFSTALCLKGREPVGFPIEKLTQSDCLVALFLKPEDAKAARAAFLRHFWDFKTSALRSELLKLAKEHGGRLL